MLHAYGFLAVFAAGLSLRRLEQRETDSGDASSSAASMTQAVLSFNEQAERIGEVAIVITVGALLWAVQWQMAHWGFVALLFVLIRPLAVGVGLAASPVSRGQRWLIGWFGIRGVGSLYYLMFAVNHGLDPALAQRLTALTLAAIVVSIVVHGVSVTPLMNAYEKAIRTRRRT